MFFFLFHFLDFLYQLTVHTHFFWMHLINLFTCFFRLWRMLWHIPTHLVKLELLESFEFLQVLLFFVTLIFSVKLILIYYHLDKLFIVFLFLLTMFFLFIHLFCQSCTNFNITYSLLFFFLPILFFQFLITFKSLLK